MERPGGKMRNKVLVAAIAFSVVIGLSGCSGSMSKEEAAEKYLDVACPVRLIGDAGSSVLAGSDIGAINRSEAKFRDALQAEAKALGDDSTPWPSKVKPLMEKLAQELIPGISVANQFANADSFDEMRAIDIPSTTVDQTIQELRIALDLPSDIKELCLSR